MRNTRRSAVLLNPSRTLPAVCLGLEGPGPGAGGMGLPTKGNAPDYCRAMDRTAVVQTTSLRRLAVRVFVPLALAGLLLGSERGEVAAQLPYCRLDGPNLCVGTHHLYQVRDDATTSPFYNILANYSGWTSNARPEFVDLDGDKDFDLLVGSYIGTVLYYENIGNRTHAVYKERTGSDNPMDGVDVGFRSDVAAADWDGDGDADLLLGWLVESNTTWDQVFWNNTGNATHANFTRVFADNGTFDIAIDSVAQQHDLRSFSFRPVDLDADGMLDLVIGSGAHGTFSYFHNEGTATTPNLTAQNFSLTGVSLHTGFTTLDVGDFDNDGDLDIATGEFSGSVTLFMNFGSNTTEDLRPVSGEQNPVRFGGEVGIAPTQPPFACTNAFTPHACFLICTPTLQFFGVYQGRYASVALVDIDGDSDLDLVYGFDEPDIRLYECTDRTVTKFAALPDASSPISAYQVASYASPALLDWDNDGDLDAVVADRVSQTGATHLWRFENVGSPTSPEYHWAGGASCSAPCERGPDELIYIDNEDGDFASDYIRPAAADIDADGDLDVIAGSYLGYVYHWDNTGNATHPNYTRVAWGDSPFGSMDIGWQAAPYLFDYDDDLDLDLILGDWYGDLYFFENTGTAAAAVYTQLTGTHNPFDSISTASSRNSVPAMVDIDLDDDFDLVLGGYEGELVVYTNTGNATAGVWSYDCDNDVFRDVDVGDTAAPAVGDLDGDGDVDVVVGTWTGHIFVYMRGRCFSANPCNLNGGCIDDVLNPQCSCFLGTTGEQCNTCLDGFWGTECSLCPGAGTVASPDLSNVCNQRGVCDDGVIGTGVCMCSAGFSGEACEEGTCAAGYELLLNSATDLYECFPCAPGTFKSNASSNDEFCQACPVGMFASENASTLCTPCSPGRYADSTGATECNVCAASTYATGNGSVICATCNSNAGYTTHGTGAAVCDSCLLGYVWHEEKGECRKCEDGMDCSTGGVTLAAAGLLKNRWRVTDESVRIESCPLRNACPGGNGTADALCASGFQGPLCAVCADDHYFDSGRSTCRKCSSAGRAGSAIVGIILLFLAVLLALGYCMFKHDSSSAPHTVTNDSESSSPSNTNNDSVAGTESASGTVNSLMRLTVSMVTGGELSAMDAAVDESAEQAESVRQKRQQQRESAVIATAQLETESDVEEEGNATGKGAECAEGPHGETTEDQGNDEEVGNQTDQTVASALHSAHVRTTAMEAKEGDIDNGNSGDKAPPQTTAPQAAAGGESRHASRSSSWQRRGLRTKLKIVLVFLQICTSLPFVLDLDWPDLYNEFLATIGFVDLDFLRLISVDCIQDFDFVDELIFMTLTPVCLCAAIALYGALHAFGLRRGDANTRVRAQLLEQYSQLLLLLSFLVLPSVSSKIFRTYPCYTLDDGKSYLRSDYSLNCSSDRYAFAVAYASVFIVVYPVGIPLFYVWILWKHRDRINPRETHAIRMRAVHIHSDRIDLHLEDAVQLAKMEVRERDHGLAPFAFLFEAYMPRMWGFEIFECVRRIVLTGLMVFFLEGTAVQVVIAMLLALVCVEVYVKLRPFVGASDNGLAELTVWQVFALFWVALLIRVNVTADDHSSQDVYGVLLILLTVVSPLMGGVLLLWHHGVELLHTDHRFQAKRKHDLIRLRSVQSLRVLPSTDGMDISGGSVDEAAATKDPSSSSSSGSKPSPPVCSSTVAPLEVKQGVETAKATL